MLKLRIQWMFFRCLIACLIATIPLGCATKSTDSRADGKFFVPSAVNPPDNLPKELQPYLIRFEQVLEYYGFKVEATTNPQAFQLQLDYIYASGETTVGASILQNKRPVLEVSETYTGKWAPWRSKITDKGILLDGLVDKTVSDFDDQLKEFSPQVRIAREQGPVTSSNPSESGFTEFGTAFAINSLNTYLTARHIIANSSEIDLYCGPGKSGRATVESNDAGNDIAVLHSDLKAGAFLELARDSSAATGDHVFTMGFPAWDILGVAPKYTDGVISSLSGFGDTKSLMQITVPIQPGNSGGPLVDTSGRVVGVITSTAAIPYFLHYTGTLPQNVNFAVSSYYAYPLVKDIPHVDAGSIAKMSAITRVTASVCLVAVKAGSQ